MDCGGGGILVDRGGVDGGILVDCGGGGFWSIVVENVELSEWIVVGDVEYLSG